MKHEPIAWTCWSEGMPAAIVTTTEPDMYGWQSIIPLFSHPVKELSRELLDKTILDQQNEIKDLRKNLDVALMIVNKTELTDEEIRQCILEYFESPEYNQYPLPVVSVKFARAILRKAQEK